MLKGKTVVLGVTGSIAAYKIANLASSLVKLHADVHVIMTKNATNFINPITFETLTQNKCMVDTFDRNFSFDVAHVSIADKRTYAYCTRVSEYNRKNGSRNCRRHAQHYISRRKMPCYCVARDECKYVHKSGCAGQYRNA